MTVTTPLADVVTEWRRERSAVRSLPARLTSGPQSGPRAENVGLRDRRRDRTVDRAQQVRDVFGGALRVVERAVVVGVGGADVGEVAPRHDEHRAPVLRHRDHRGDVVAHLRPRHGDVHALGGADRVGVACLRRARARCRTTRRSRSRPFVRAPGSRAVDDDPHALARGRRRPCRSRRPSASFTTAAPSSAAVRAIVSVSRASSARAS